MNTAAPAVSSREALDQRLLQDAERISKVKATLLAELDKIGLASKCQGILDDFTSAELCVDPYDKSVALHGRWRNAFGMNQGSLQLRDSGQVFAEYDVLVVHPTKPKWFIEAVTAWGNDDALKSELRLLPVPGA